MSSKAFLEYSIQIFALVANRFPALIIKNLNDFVRGILLREFSLQVVEQYMLTFNNLYQHYAQIRNSPEGEEQIREILLETIIKINSKISKKNKFYLLIRLMLFERFLLQYLRDDKDTAEFENILVRLASEFHINKNEFSDCRNFIAGKLYNIKDKSSLLIMGPQNTPGLKIDYLQLAHLKGQVMFLYIRSIRLIAFYLHGSDILFLNERSIYADHIYPFQRGHSIKGPGLEPVTYNQVLRRFCSGNEYKINIEVNNLEYRFRGSNRGIHTLSLNMQSGELIGIIGRSGTGKSTLLNLLNGNLVPLKGTIRINTFDIQKDKSKLDGLIGFVPQDDLLVEELTVFRNLYLNAQLCFSNLSAKALTDKVNNLLMEMNLYEVKDLKVGNPLNKYISGGQRKKLNIALELIREPWILYADEPTSGLSSTDSEEIMNYLSDQALSGRLVMVNVHQPSSDIFKLFDKIIVMDNEGYPLYFGDPASSIVYFNHENGKEISLADSCNTCGNLNPESIFKALEEKQIDEFGEITQLRKTSPAEWHQRFLSSVDPPLEQPVNILPPRHLHQPNQIRQFMIFFNRNFLTKIANPTYVVLALGISPLLALILSFLCHSGSEENSITYSFGANENIPAFLFMSVIVALFVGLIISAEEIIRDRKILLRESFLKLSKLSYLHSKMVYLFGLSAVQTFLYVLISNYILGMEGMLLRFWIILFSTSCLANVLGLVISSLFNSVVAIYVLVPLLIVPQILLSGVVVNYEKLNRHVTSQYYVPLVGDLMASRWAYEAMLTSQYRYNDFEKHFFRIEMQKSNFQFDYLFIIPELKNRLQSRNVQTDSVMMKQSRFIRNELDILRTHYPMFPLLISEHGMISPMDRIEIEKQLDRLSGLLSKKINELTVQKDSVIHRLSRELGGSVPYLAFKNRYYNRKLSSLMLNRQSLVPFVISNDEMIRRIEPVFEIPASKIGQAPFLVSYKRIGTAMIPTLAFNVLILWVMLGSLYIILILTNLRWRINLQQQILQQNK